MDNGKDPWATIQRRDTQFRQKQYKVKRSELIKIPGQPQTITDNLEEDLPEATYSKIEDEILKDTISCLSTIITERLKRKQSFNIAPGDYEKLLQLYEDDGDDVSFYYTNGDHAETDETLLQDLSDTSDTWLLPNPNNSPTIEDIMSQPVDPTTLIEVLKEVADDMGNFNQQHPQDPRRSQRNIARPSSYNYSGRNTQRTRGRSE